MSLTSPHSDEHIGAWIALKLVRGVGCVLYQGLLRAFGHPRAALAASPHALECAGVRREVADAIHRFDEWRRVDEQLARVRRCGARVVTWTDRDYPENLRQIHDPPPFLFIRGALQPADRLAVALVGSRTASSYGLQITREISQGLARAGVTVVSGLARGIDAEAHRATIEADGRTAAVLGSGIDVVYPSEHHALFTAIAEHGAVMSEFLMGTKPDAENFPSRNRIISGLALGTVIVEATEKSGSLITAQAAVDQGREVFAVPGPVGARSRGTHKLIREGAKLTERVEDILEEIAPRLLDPRERPQPLPELNAAETQVLAGIGGETRHVDELISGSGLAPSQVLDALLTLELKGVVQQLPGKHYTARGVDPRAMRPARQ
ncbi:MAG TPA: DNA-processing protein DprA [Candidatus Kryptonia bacterium]|nr:DNA-processing protein DprA [Candidatus Kryptonia bacterium]